MMNNATSQPMAQSFGFNNAFNNSNSNSNNNSNMNGQYAYAPINNGSNSNNNGNLSVPYTNGNSTSHHPIVSNDRVVSYNPHSQVYPQQQAAPRPEAMIPVKLFENNKERDLYETFADLYAIIRTVEALEKAYVRDSIPPAVYTPTCSKLIAQFKTARQLVPQLDVKQFMVDYKLDCPAAAHRLLEIGVPSTVEHGGGNASTGNTSTSVGFAVAADFITAMDVLKLSDLQKDKGLPIDQLHPYISALMNSLNSFKSLPPTYRGKEKVREWLVVLNKMRATDVLDEAQMRQLLFDLEASYSELEHLLRSGLC